MAILKGGKSQYPFWGASLNLITGLDPLGLQTTSEATYAVMLPGISNLTNRLRYYGFYCWLLNFYFTKERTGNSTEQYKFIRRAELMVAILMNSQRADVQQITGSRFAVGMIDFTEGSYYDLANGADKNDPNKAVYWKYPSGAFGQYYSGPMQSLSLVIAAINSDDDVIYKITEPAERQKVSGRDLANAFDNSLNEEVKELFYNSIKKGKLFKSNVERLVEHFYIDTIEPISDEWNLYIQMLLDKDEPAAEVESIFSFHRMETIKLLIQGGKANSNKYDWYNFLLDCYSKKNGSESNKSPDTVIGWYCYQLNEYWQFACGSILWGALQFLYTLQTEQYVPSLVQKLAENSQKALEKELSQKGLKISSVIERIATETEESIFKRIDVSSSGDAIKAIKDGLCLLFKIYHSNKEQLPFLKDFIKKLGVERDGNMVDGLMLIHNSQEKDLLEFLKEFILRNIIYRHQMVAFRKMGNGTQSTQKFIIEDQQIRLIDTFPPRNTSPRMNALKNILYDLQIIDDKGYLTNLHSQAI